jgi:hypothetical protein
MEIRPLAIAGTHQFYRGREVSEEFRHRSAASVGRMQSAISAVADLQPFYRGRDANERVSASNWSAH